MKTRKTIITVLSMMVLTLMISCGNKENKAPVESSPEMQAFMAALKGTEKDVSNALAQYGAEGLDKKDMDMYGLQEPTLISCEKKDGKEWCTMEAKAGMTTRTYTLCWENGKIVAIEDKGMR
jgi:hypothetical protein